MGRLARYKETTSLAAQPFRAAQRSSVGEFCIASGAPSRASRGLRGLPLLARNGSPDMRFAGLIPRRQTAHQARSAGRLSRDICPPGS